MEELGALLFSVGDDDLFSASLDILRAPQSETTPEERLQALTELEDLVHSIDSGSFSRRETGFRFFSRLHLWIRLSEGDQMAEKREGNLSV